MSEAGREPKTADLQDIVRRIVEVADPERIIMFGSAASGGMGPNSDVDLLVVKSGADRLQLAQKIYRNLHGAAEAVDVIVVTPEDVEKYRDNPTLVVKPALDHGKKIYDSRMTKISGGKDRD